MAVRLRESNTGFAVSLTPMIDVVFLLLIFFLVASQFSQEERVLPIELPNASSAVPMTARPKELVVEIDREGTLYLDGVVTTIDLFEQVLTQAVANNPTTQTVVVRADRRTELQSAVAVVDLCNRSGAEHALIMQEPQPSN